MRTTNLLLIFLFLSLVSFSKENRNEHYITIQSPLVAQPYTALPLGTIKPKGMLLEMLEVQRDGLTGNIDSVYSLVCGPNNGWPGGTGDGWERGPYWLDGLVPLAYILDDENLKDKAQEWIEWSLENQREDGYFGPRPLPEGYERIPGTQQGNREDWWPKMVMLKVLQQANQVQITDEVRNFFQDNHGRIVYGTTTGYPCCLTNMHQGWPKFVQNLWYATADNGLAALVYGPSEVTAKVAGGQEVTISEKTNYPFDEEIQFTIETSQNTSFPFHLRIPEWCESYSIDVNGQEVKTEAQNNVVILNREWNSGDVVKLNLGMDFRYSNWYENSLGIERGPLVYALKIKEEWREITKDGYDDTYFEVYPQSPGIMPCCAAKLKTAIYRLKRKTKLLIIRGILPVHQ